MALIIVYDRQENTDWIIIEAYLRPSTPLTDLLLQIHILQKDPAA